MGQKAEDPQDRHKALMKSLKQSLVSVSQTFSDLEKVSNNLEPMRSMSNIDYLSLDPVDKNSVLHSQILQSYKWTNKMHELANSAFQVLSQNGLKRTQPPFYANPHKKLRATYVQPAEVDAFIHQLDQTHPDMKIMISRPLGNSGIVQIELKRVLRAVIVLRGLMIEWVKIKGFDESFKTDDGQLDIWSSSRHQVFQKITDHAEAATLHYYAPSMPSLAIR